MGSILTLVLVAAAGIEPVGSPETIDFDGETGHRAGAKALQLEVTGPTVLVLDVRGTKSAKGSIDLVLERDAAFTSTTSVKLKKHPKGGPKGYPMAGRLMVKVPPGTHTYAIKCSEELAVLASMGKKLKKNLAASPEQPLSGSEPPPEPVAEADEPPPAEEAPAEEAPAEEAAAKPAGGATGAEVAAEVASPDGTGDGSAPPPVAAPGDGSRPIRVAVSSLELQGVDTNIGEVVSDSVVAEIRKLAGVSAVGMDEVQDMLGHEASKQAAGCEDDSCMAEIAGALGVDQVLMGTLTRAADMHVIALRRIDQGRAQVVGVFNRSLKAESGQEFLLAVGTAVEELFPERALRDGATRGVPKETALRLDPPPLPRWSFWTVAGSAAAAAAAGGVFGILYLGAQDEYGSLADRSQTELVDGKVLTAKGREVEQHALTADVLFGTAGALAIASGIMWLFTDWQGYGEAAE